MDESQENIHKKVNKQSAGSSVYSKMNQIVNKKYAAYTKNMSNSSPQNSTNNHDIGQKVSKPQLVK